MSDPINFDKFTDNYDALLKKHTKYFSSNEAYFAKYKVDIVRQHITQPISRVLEYGCGIGRNIPFLQEAFPNACVIGSDISAESLSIAKIQNPNTMFIQETEISHDIELFDLIFVAGVFHHIEPEERAKQCITLFSRLHLGGEIVVFEHNPYNPITRRIVNNCPYDEGVVLVTPAEMQQHLEQAGLKVKNKSYCLFLPPKLNKLLRVNEHYLRRLPVGGQYWIRAIKS